MAAFTLAQSEKDPSLFFVVGPDGTPASDINAFLLHLSHLGRSAYTLRSYAQGLAHFFDWLHRTGCQVDEVTPQVIEAYITAFSFQAKGGACPVNPAKAGQINLLTRKSAPGKERQPRTINHRLSVLASFFAYRIQADTAQGNGPWVNRFNPVPASSSPQRNAHGMPGRDIPRRGKRGELRRRVPRHLPRQVNPPLAQQFIDTAHSWRDKAILTLLYRTGQRIGDWSEFAGRHGILGMTLADVDEQASTITVLLKGARDEHRVPVTEDFWPCPGLTLQERWQNFEQHIWPQWLAGQGRPPGKWWTGGVRVAVTAHLVRPGWELLCHSNTATWMKSLSENDPLFHQV
jgi:integrase/recombinase XerD